MAFIEPTTEVMDAVFSNPELVDSMLVYMAAEYQLNLPEDQLSEMDYHKWTDAQHHFGDFSF